MSEREDIVRLLRAMATGSIYIENEHDIILIAAANLIERAALASPREEKEGDSK